MNGKLAEEQLAALKQYATKAAAAETSGSGKWQPADSDPKDAPDGAEGPLAKESRGTSELEGTWAFVSMEAGRPDGKGTNATFEGAKIAMYLRGRNLYRKPWAMKEQSERRANSTLRWTRKSIRID